VRAGSACDFVLRIYLYAHFEQRCFPEIDLSDEALDELYHEEFLKSEAFLLSICNYLS
jgi:hypothetical protein